MFERESVDVRLYRWRKDGVIGTLLSPLKYDNGHFKLEVPAGFDTDFASIPQIFHSLVGRIGKHTLPAVLHDYLYAEGAKLGINRETADYIFYEAMLRSSVHKITAFIMWKCVRLFGAKAYASI